MNSYPFTAEELEAAYAAWGCNCGPTALAFSLWISLDDAHELLPEFDERRYTNPTMMLRALTASGCYFRTVRNDLRASMFQPEVSLVRIQWTGPWTGPGANPRWAYRHTHWIATWRQSEYRFVFDCNGGIRTVTNWEEVVVPKILATIPRADGGWFPTHVHRLRRLEELRCRPTQRVAASLKTNA